MPILEDIMEIQKIAKEIHENSPLVDAHLDLGAIVYEGKRRGETRVIEEHFLGPFKAAGIKLVVGAIFVDDIYLPEKALRVAVNQVEDVLEEIEESSDLMLVTDGGSLEACLEGDRIGIILSLEGADPLYDDLDLLKVFYRLGVRGLGLTWSRRNSAADGSFFSPRVQGKVGGLTPFGVALIREAEALGMFLDYSHLNDEGFLDAVAFSERPFIFSHSNSRALHPSMRNISHEMMEVLKARGGVIGMNGVRSLISDERARHTIAHFTDHFEDTLKEVGYDHVGLGLDLCNLIMPRTYPVDLLEDHGQVILITEELLRRGHRAADIEKILGGSFLRFFQKHWEL
jgi:membrane dipeptidase